MPGAFTFSMVEWSVGRSVRRAGALGGW